MTLCNGDLAADAAELIRSLGYKTSIRESDATLEGRVVGRRWRMCFTAYDQVFCLSRKAERHGQNRPEPNDTCRWRSVVRIERAESVPVKCIAVDGDATYLMGRSYTVTHNTTQLSILKLLHMMGENPNIHIAIVSKTGATSGKSGRAIREYIERNEDLREIYPELCPGDLWAEKQFTIKRSSYSKDPTVQCLGLGGTIIGSRVDVLMFDDILDDENTLSPAERKKVFRRVKAMLERLSDKGVAWMLTNAWHPDDAAHTLERESWPCFRFPVIDEDGVSNWPAKWDEDRIEQMRTDLGPLGFARAFLCKARDEGESPFDEDALDRAFEAGREVDLVHRLVRTTLPAGAMICCGVDLAVTKKKGSHLTAFSTCLLWPEPDGRMVRQLLWCESGRWSSREIRDRFLDIDRRYTPLFVVENNAAQRWIIDIVFNQADLPPEERRMPEIVPFTTGKNKAHPQYGVEGLAVEIANDLWIFTTNGPCGEEVLALRTDMAYYQRGAHTGDRLMSLWLCREGMRRGAHAGTPEKDEERDLSPAGFGSASAGVRIIG